MHRSRTAWVVLLFVALCLTACRRHHHHADHPHGGPPGLEHHPHGGPPGLEKHGGVPPGQRKKHGWYE